MSKKNYNTFFGAQLDAIKAQMEADELAAKKAKEEKRAAERKAIQDVTAAHCKLFDKICDLISAAIEELKQDDEISDSYLELVNEVEELTGTLITAKTSAKEVTAITRQYLAAIGK